MYVIYDLKLYVNYIELDVGEAGVELGYSQGEKLWGVCNTWGEMGLVISVEQRHGASVAGYSKLLKPNGFLCNYSNRRSLCPYYVVPGYICYAISDSLFFLCRLKINQMMQLQLQLQHAFILGTGVFTNTYFRQNLVSQWFFLCKK